MKDDYEKALQDWDLSLGSSLRDWAKATWAWMLDWLKEAL